MPGNMVTLAVPDHKEIAKGTLGSLVRAAGLTVDTFVSEAARLSVMPGRKPLPRWLLRLPGAEMRPKRRHPTVSASAHARLLICAAAVLLSAPSAAQVAANPATHLWLQRQDVRLPIVRTGDMDLRGAVSAWAGRRDELNRLAGPWLVEPAPLPWNNLALSLIVKYQQNPLRAVRVLALLHAAIGDAVATAQDQSGDEAAQAIAAHAAASAVLDHLYPNEASGRIEALGRMAYAAIALGQPDRLDGWQTAWVAGRQVAARAVSRALEDGASQVWQATTQRPAPAPGRWRAAPPLNFARPLEPLAGTWRTWVLTSGGEIAPPPPPAYGTPAYASETAAVLQVWRTLTAEQKRIADEWNLAHGSVTPAGVWNQRAHQLVQANRLGTAATASLLATLNIAMADAFIACWHVKFTHWTQRPVHAVRQQLDPDFLPYLLTPPFPSYVSGHATASGAAAEVLAAWFPAQRQQVIAWAEEAAQSRLYGGIHFAVDNDEGLKLGRQIGRRVLAQVMPAPGRP